MASSSGPSNEQAKEKSCVPDCDPPSATRTESRTPEQVAEDDDLELFFSVMNPVGYAAYNRSDGYVGNDQPDSPRLRSRIRHLIAISEDSMIRAEEKDNKKRRWDDIVDVSDMLDPALSEAPMVRGKENRRPTLRERLRSLPPSESRLWASRYLKHARDELWGLLQDIQHEQALERRRRRYPLKKSSVPTTTNEMSVESTEMAAGSREMDIDTREMVTGGDGMGMDISQQMAIENMEEGEIFDWMSL